jgi:two-component system chemotaxis response regulator CheB
VEHRYSAEAMLSEQAESVEAAVWAAINALEEQASLKRRLANKSGARHNPKLAARLTEQAQEAQDHANLIHQALLGVVRTHRAESEAS